MQFNQPNSIVKNLYFGNNAQTKVMKGINKLNNAVKSTLGASGKCVIYEDTAGNPIVTKDGVTVANSVVLMDSTENVGATLIKEAAQKTVKEAGDGTTTSTVLAHSILTKYIDSKSSNLRKIKEGILSATEKVIKLLDKEAIPVNDSMLNHVAEISTNNDKELGSIIADAYKKVGNTGVVLMEESDTEKTHVEIVDGVQFESALKSPHLITDKEKSKSVLEDALVLIVDSEVTTIRKIQTVLEYAIKNKKAILIIANLVEQPLSALIMNKVKGNIKVNIIDPPSFSLTRKDILEDLSLLTGAKLISEELGDDLDLIDVDCLGYCKKVVTDSYNTIITVDADKKIIDERIKSIDKQIKALKNPFKIKKLEERKAMLLGSVGIIKVGANSEIELKEKKDRVEDAIYAVKAALKEGIVPGGGAALHNISSNIKTENKGENILLEAIKEPCRVILDNAGIPYENYKDIKGYGINVNTGDNCNLIKEGIIDPVLVTKTALKNAVSVATTIMSADCVISNVREDESSQ